MPATQAFGSRVVALRGPAALVTLCALPVVLWLGSASLGERFDGRYGTLTSLAVALAFAGTAAFALNLVLGARLRLVEALYGGLDRMYDAHRATGKVAFALLLGHVVLILASRTTISASAALDLLGPGAGWTVFAGVLAFGAMTIAIALTLFARLGHEVFVYVQRSFGFAFLLATYHVFTTSGAKDDSSALNLYMVVLATLGIAAFVYRSLLGNLLVRRRSYRVTDVHRLDEYVTEIVMEPIGRPLRYAPGQFVFVSFRSAALRTELHPFELSVQRQVLSFRPGEVANQFHPFSITSAPGEPELRITVKAVGDYTSALRRLEPGAEAVVEGAYGSFSHPASPNGRQVWLAGGIGVTPFIGMARSLGDGPGPAVDFYYCVEHDEEAHFLDELRAIAGRRADFRLTIVPRDRDGFLTAERLAMEIPTLRDVDVLVCGPPAMIDSVRAQLRAVGVAAERIRAEEFAFAKLGATRTMPVGPLGAARPGTRRRWSDGQLIAFFAAAAFAALAFAAGLVVGHDVLAGSGAVEIRDLATYLERTVVG
jgi:predicted ferric reductase